MLDNIDGSIYKPTKEVVLYKHLGDAIRVYEPGYEDLVVDGTVSVMYHSLELYQFGGERGHIFKVLYDNKIWYVFHERNFERIG